MGTDIDVDEADVLVLSQGLERSSRLSFQISKSLKRIATTSGQSSGLFTPILSRNNLLATMQRNIESTLNSVSSVKDLANEASKHEVVLTRGIGEVGLKAYTQAIHKLDDMLEDIESGKGRQERDAEFTGMVTHLADMIRSSELELKKYFVAILNVLKPFDPQININKKIPFPYFEDEHLYELAFILDYFQNSEDNHSIQGIFVQERTKNILESMAFLEPFAKQITTSENTPYSKGGSGMVSYTEALSGFLSNEQSLINDVFTQYSDLKSQIFADIIKPLLNVYIKLFHINLGLVQKNMQNVGLFSFELVESINEIRRSLRSSPLKDYQPIEACGAEATAVTQKLLEDIIGNIRAKVSAVSALPADNGVTEATVDTMSRLRKLSEYKAGCLGAIQSMNRESWLPVGYKSREYTFQDGTRLDDPSLLLSCYISDCIDTLVTSLERMAQQKLMPNQEPDVANPNSTRNTEKQRIGLFILINMALTEQIIDKSELQHLLGTEGHNRMQKIKKRYINYLVSDWKDLAANLMDSVFVDSSGKIASKDKDQIKEKFKRFNEGFEELVSKFKSYRFSDPTLKAALKSEIISLVMPMYERFYGRYKDSFKNPRKHIKYTPSELTSVLNQLGR